MPSSSTAQEIRHLVAEMTKVPSYLLHITVGGRMLRMKWRVTLEVAPICTAPSEDWAGLMLSKKVCSYFLRLGSVSHSQAHHWVGYEIYKILQGCGLRRLYLVFTCLRGDRIS